ncbi:MAG: hypothetical protein JXA97_10805 [Anaerolineales bacterium]|nr:hypothetical protein [Anaerolineales bacterium]
MGSTISVSEDQNYIILKAVGNYTRELAMADNLKAHAMGREMGIKLYLSDMTEARNIETTTDNYYFANKDMKTTPGIDPHARVALLVQPEDRSHDFVETVSRNAGFNVKIFRDRELAIQYLLDS